MEKPSILFSISFTSPTSGFEDLVAGDDKAGGCPLNIDANSVLTSVVEDAVRL
jgi:hypothetical protein